MWSETEVSEDEARQIIHERAKDASEKAQGHTPGHLKEAIDQLAKPIVRWRELFRQWISKNIGNRRKTYSRVDRRQGTFGTKGISHHACSDALIIVDTSGSISKKELSQFFAEIEAVAVRARLSILQFDAAPQGYTPRYRRGDWKTYSVSGGGGTDLNLAFKYAEENGIMASVCILLTDGYTSWPAPRPYPTVFCITTPEGSSAAPEWGTVVRLKLD